MRQVLWVVLAVLGLIWSALAWLFYSLAGAGGAAVVRVTRWFDADPSTTQWLADGLSLAGGLAQWLVVAGWLLGLAVLGLVAWLVNRAEKAVQQSNPYAEMAYREPALDGEIRFKKVSDPGEAGAGQTTPDRGPR
ncbi:hypothetical protein L6Q21_00020 [Sandaracinobacter sp. RS1-74]|uniref:hypothetical protein n=1 Tax=Sandaracinobacteroides sayramensis TaxID=2913411 RepID=UPI001EDA9B69|nr:hypothetical protein [Sandaracinobacteroides sayramensis]MCG2839361.1 hypothetical protein [Sandaracinobacteroides sayramensis]